MRPVGIATDSSSDLNLSLSMALDIPIAPIMVRFDDDEVELRPTMDHQRYFERVEHGHLRGTSGVNTSHWLAAYQSLADHCESIIAVSLAQPLSTTYQAATIAQSLFDEKPVHVFDTDTVFAGTALLAMGAAELAKADATSDAVLEWLEWAKLRTHTFLISPSLAMLERIGRVFVEGEAPAGSLSLVQTREGRLRPIGLARGWDDAMDQVLALLDGQPLDFAMRLVLDHCRAPGPAEAIRERFSRSLGLRQVAQIDDGPAIPIVADGFGGIALAVGPLPPTANSHGGV